MTGSKSISPKGKVALLAGAHFVNDLHTLFLDTFLPYLARNLGLSYSQAGLLTSLSGLLNTVFQPIMGSVSDRYTRLWPVMLGPVGAALGASFIPLSTSYPMAIGAIFLWGIGTSAFHPQGQGSLGYVQTPAELPFAISIFAMGGMIGGTLSPLYAVTLHRYVPHPLIPLAVLFPPAVMAMLFCRFMPSIRESGGKTDSSGMIKNLASVFRVLYPLLSVTFLRDCTYRGVRFLIPMVIMAQGNSVATVGIVLFALSFMATFLPMIAARIAMKVGNSPVIRTVMACSGVTLTTAWFLRGPASLALFVLGGAMLPACAPSTDAMAQNMSQGKRSTASSFMNGFSFGLGGVAIAPLGWFTDAAGLHAALGLIAVLPFISLPIIMFLWPRKNMA